MSELLPHPLQDRAGQPDELPPVRVLIFNHKIVSEARRDES